MEYIYNFFRFHTWNTWHLTYFIPETERDKNVYNNGLVKLLKQKYVLGII